MSRAEGFGTLGVSPCDIQEFFGANWDAFVDSNGMLHGLPPFEALGSGYYACPSPVHEECIYIYPEVRWKKFVEDLRAELSSEQKEGTDRLVPHCLARAKRIIEHQPSKSALREGLARIPDDVLSESGITANEGLVIIGNSGYFEIWRKSAFGGVVEEIDLYNSLFGS